MCVVGVTGFLTERARARERERAQAREHTRPPFEKTNIGAGGGRRPSRHKINERRHTKTPFIMLCTFRPSPTTTAPSRQFCGAPARFSPRARMHTVPLSPPLPACSLYLLAPPPLPPPLLAVSLFSPPRLLLLPLLLPPLLLLLSTAVLLDASGHQCSAPHTRWSSAAAPTPSPHVSGSLPTV